MESITKDKRVFFSVIGPNGLCYVEFGDNEVTEHPQLLTDPGFRQSFVDGIARRSPEYFSVQANARVGSTVPVQNASDR